LYTSPIPPTPTTLMISYGPTRVPEVSGMSFDGLSCGQRTGRTPALEGAWTPAAATGDYTLPTRSKRLYLSLIEE
jgi:hypothetical protein